MSTLEGARIITGVPLAILLPIAITWLSSNSIHSIVATSLYGAYVSLPLFPAWQFWLILAIASILHLVIRLITNTHHTRITGRERWVAIHARRQSIGIIVTLFVAIAFSVLLSRGLAGLRSVFELIRNDKAAIVLSGGLWAVFIGGVVVALIVKPIAAASEESTISVPRLLQVGAHVGHIERLLFFIFIVGGAPAAAALALTAKSLVRLPSVSDDMNHAEYYLVGTLSSAAVCLVAAVGTRLALGLAPL
jgi:hypothetical protein